MGILRQLCEARIVIRETLWADPAIIGIIAR